ncbi:glycoside hydrolase family protein [Flaviaesturariibacter amylovorans]|uniref:Lysozyme n=1 Tax=Flaviaesturariibacter amylovorans TaxID=1084520 RepID=A0ABP8HNC2_9BACT
MPFKEKYTVSPLYLPKPSRRRGGAMLGPVKFIVAHDTGNPGSSARANVNYYIKTAQTVPPAQTASAHLFVDDKEILECVPALTAAPEKAWHVLYRMPKDNELYGANANDAAIGVELCYGGNIDDDKAYAKYVWVLAKICHQFGLDPATSVVGHFFLDPKRKTDPVTGLAHSRRTYERLLKDVVTEYNDCTGAAPAPTFNEVPFVAEVLSAVKLNIREQPATRSGIVQTLPPRTPIRVVARVDNGEPVNNNRVWYKDSNGNYCWSGGVTPPPTPPQEGRGAPIPSPSQREGGASPATPMANTNNVPMTGYKPDKRCIDFIKAHEGLRLTAYQDSAGIWTIGYGTIRYADQSPVKPGDQIDPTKAEALLAMEVEEKSASVRKLIQNPSLTQNQFDALVSFAYNVGTGALRSSTLLKRVNANPSDPSIREAFLMWNKAHVDGKLVEIDGLSKRRGEEADLYFS